MRGHRAALAFAVVLALLCAALPAVAQKQDDQPHMLTWVNVFKVHPGKSMEFQKAFEKFDKPVLEKLRAEGTIVSWGLAYAMIGPPGAWQAWATTTDWASLGKIDAAFAASHRAMSKEDIKELVETFVGSTDPDSQQTIVLRELVSEGSPDATPKFLMLGLYKAKPGKGNLATSMYKAYVAPVYKKLLADGAILGYGFGVQDMHTDASWTHVGWLALSDLSQVDAVDAAFDQAEKDRPEGANSTIRAAFMTWSKPGAHRDALYRIVMYGAGK